MKNPNRFMAAITGAVALFTLSGALAQDWPQWRGPSRDAKASGFTAPDNWPSELAKKWKTTVGKGDSSPAVVGDRLYVFARREGREIILCLDAAQGKELWREQYDSLDATGPSARHSGPRSSPAVINGKLLAYGVRGTLSCVDAQSGKLLWRKDDLSGVWPRFFTASSPLVVDSLCVAQLGGEEKGAIVAYDLNTGAQKWKWDGDGTAYASPVVLTAAGLKQIVTLTAKNIVGLGTADGKLLWQSPFAPTGRAYNAATPIVDGDTIICAGAGRGAKALKIAQEGGRFAPKELWSNPDNAVQFNTPVLKQGLLFGVSQAGDLFCLNAQNGKTLWTSPTGARGGFGSIVDAGSALVALTPQSELVIFHPSDKEFKKITAYKVADSETYAYPVLARNGIYVKDQDSLTLWTLK